MRPEVASTLIALCSVSRDINEWKCSGSWARPPYQSEGLRLVFRNSGPGAAQGPVLQRTGRCCTNIQMPI